MWCSLLLTSHSWVRHKQLHGCEVLKLNQEPEPLEFSVSLYPREVRSGITQPPASEWRSLTPVVTGESSAKSWGLRPLNALSDPGPSHLLMRILSHQHSGMESKPSQDQPALSVAGQCLVTLPASWPPLFPWLIYIPAIQSSPFPKTALYFAHTKHPPSLSPDS